jgi:Asp-tRNA(Asn)/Glu-tRNA(Gln) amidotransferase A subunit family amidase
MTTQRVGRRTFLLASLAFARAVRAQGGLPESFREWRDASLTAREAALPRLLERIRALDPQIHAWVQVSPEPALGRGALSGIPIAVKDIIETKGLATEFGSAVYKGRLGTSDAAIVRDVRSRGAVVLGKTHTAAFAFQTPPPTRNPRDLAHTPGGSSSGSAAAVAAGMTPVAIGTQTSGSVLRPASFCGVTGFKATYGLLSTEGVMPFAKSQDTLGFFTHTAADMIAFWEAIGQSIGRAEPPSFAVVDPLPEADAEMAAAFHDAVTRLRRAGQTLRTVNIAPMLVKLIEASRTINRYEGARAREADFKQYGERLDAAVVTMIQNGLKLPEPVYQSAKAYVAECRAKMTDIYGNTPIVLVPAAPGPAPLGLSSTGDSRMNSPWTALGTPAISIPMPVASGLPLGLQLTAERGEDARLLRAATLVETALRDRSSRG